MRNNGPFGFDPEDFDRVLGEVGEKLRDAFGRVFEPTGERAVWSGLFEEFVRPSRSTTAPETAGETGDGVWAIYQVDVGGNARVEQVFPTEVDALRANKDNTDEKRKVRFLPYGIVVSVLDATEGSD